MPVFRFHTFGRAIVGYGTEEQARAFLSRLNTGRVLNVYSMSRISTAERRGIDLAAELAKYEPTPENPSTLTHIERARRALMEPNE